MLSMSLLGLGLMHLRPP